MGLEERIARVREGIAAAARRAGRAPDGVTLVGVCKTVERPVIDRAHRAGLRHFGENRVQEARRKFGPAAPARPGDLTLHLIGSLQTNKARDALALFDVVHSVDRAGLVAALVKEAGKRAAAGDRRRLPVLLEVNIAGEASKEGAAPGEAPALAALIAGEPALELRGLMTIAPLVADPEETRPVFRALRELRDDLRRAHPQLDLPDLSMGMTNDYPVAVEEGATIVRVGRAIFAE
ncbi:MAG: YggS family pyridoxal phosphate-dependent enzyme [Chloroflexota bacterium]|nr:YggS family pyridoxal phosphate-dependent enzyme [Chloroflexota bacterium]